LISAQNWRISCAHEGFMRHHNLRKGVVVSLAPFGGIDLEGGARLVSIPLYCAGRLTRLIDAL
jgi:hypothetical protein